MSAQLLSSATSGGEKSELDLGIATLDVRPYDRWKRLFDITAAIAISLVFLPLFCVIGLALLFQGRPLLIRHRRLGRGGKMFFCLKFRTMVVNSDEVLRRHLAIDPAARKQWVTSQKLKNDPRVTPLGRVLRKSSFDELPQLFHSLRRDITNMLMTVPAVLKSHGSY